jgi:NAD(P)H-nitrite reductase large subunit
MTEKLVIIGNGMAPGRMLEHLLDKAPGRYEVTIFNAEPRVNYDRIMLSPVLSGEKDYQAKRITSRSSFTATAGTSRTASRSTRGTRSRKSIVPPRRSPPTTASSRPMTSWSSPPGRCR